MTYLQAGSQVIIEGNSSIIIESQSQSTKILVDDIITTNIGQFVYNESDSFFNEDYYNTDAIPENFVIEEAYPNPFNPTTTIKYGISKTDKVSIRIYDLIGRLVKNTNLGYQNSNRE